ncbi:MAG: hypothetical protein WC763_06260 [Candidatus Paceibacterota bacterium]|jgi:histone H3/H4
MVAPAHRKERKSKSALSDISRTRYQRKPALKMARLRKMVREALDHGAHNGPRQISRNGVGLIQVAAESFLAMHIAAAVRVVYASGTTKDGRPKRVTVKMRDLSAAHALFVM